MQRECGRGLAELRSGGLVVSQMRRRGMAWRAGAQPGNGKRTGLEGDPRTCEEAREGEAEKWAAEARGLGGGGWGG